MSFFETGVNASVSYASYLIRVGLISLGALGVTGILRNRMLSGGGPGYGGGPYDSYGGGGYGGGGYGGYGDGYGGGGFRKSDEGINPDEHKLSDKEKEYLEDYYKSYYKKYYENYYQNLKRNGGAAVEEKRTNSRKRRSVKRKSPKVRKEEEDEVLKKILKENGESCGLKLVCELAGVKERVLTKEEWDILHTVRMLRTNPRLVSPGRDSLGAEYISAAEFGRIGGDCGNLFNVCAFNASQLMDTIHQLREE